MQMVGNSMVLFDVCSLLFLFGVWPASKDQWAKGLGEESQKENRG
jgi:hypothetical protein